VSVHVKIYMCRYYTDVYMDGTEAENEAEKTMARITLAKAALW